MLKELVPVTARGEATRRRLLAAGEIEIGGKGFHATSVSAITALADVGQGTFYLYFRSKEEIFIALVGEIGRSLRKQMTAAMIGAENRFEAERRRLEAFFHFVQRQPGLYRIVQEAQFVDEPVFRDYCERMAQSYLEDLDAALKNGELTVGDSQVRAWSMMGISHFVAMRWCQWQPAPPSSGLVDAVMVLISNGMAPRDTLIGLNQR